MNSPEVKDFIRRHSSLFWYTPDDKKDDISPELLVETILNYGELDDVRELIRIVGIQEVSRYFFMAKERKKLNYYPEIYNFFNHFFLRHAQRDSIG